ncbi:hypothetical protein BJ138DRAFT_1102880 [Hygrophoropsis aurantiaca]|uniref:Uncharacterized protein n=1 Tax=Hygrophoropsis aurantiaca TaxID=72124 RepID=A0ACB8A7F5_9AGAM|nr:hypothetical protein BJ138DRAFT_1102880 [Hygrophoropsis aurantiaca]
MQLSIQSEWHRFTCRQAHANDMLGLMQVYEPSYHKYASYITVFAALEGTLHGLDSPQTRTRKYLKNFLAPVHGLPNEILQLCFYRAVQFWLGENDNADGLVRLRLDSPQTRTRKYLKNFLAPVHGLPNEILQLCFYRAVQFWLGENDNADGLVRLRGFSDGLCNTALMVSHVSHHWRQLAINMPSLWTNISITPNFSHHMDVFQDFLRRVDSMPINACFQHFSLWSRKPGSTSKLPVVEAVVPLLQTQQIAALAFLHPSMIPSYLFSRVAEQATQSHLTALTFVDHIMGDLEFNNLSLLLSATPQLKHLELELHGSRSIGSEQPIVNLPLLEKLTLIGAYPDILDCLSAPAVQHLQLTRWFPRRDDGVRFFTNGSPQFPNVQSLTLLESSYSFHQCRQFIHAFPRVTHLVLRNLRDFTNSCWESQSSPMPFWPKLQHVTLQIAFAGILESDVPHRRFTWLPQREDQTTQPLHICIFDSSEERSKRADKYLFYYYKALQEYATLEGTESCKQPVVFDLLKHYFSSPTHHDFTLRAVVTEVAIMPLVYAHRLKIELRDSSDHVHPSIQWMHKVRGKSTSSPTLYRYVHRQR